MLSKETQLKLDQLYKLMDQRIAIDEKIEALLSGGATVKDSTVRWRKRKKTNKEAPAQPVLKDRPRKVRIVPQFTDAEIEKMIRESDEGKTAREIIRECDFKSTSDRYLLKSKYKKQHRQSTDSDDMPDFDAEDDEEPDDEPVAQKTIVAAPVLSKRYDYQCNCGYSFKSTIPPQLINCPDCMGKPKLVEDVKEE